MSTKTQRDSLLDFMLGADARIKREWPASMKNALEQCDRVADVYRRLDRSDAVDSKVDARTTTGKRLDD